MQEIWKDVTGYEGLYQVSNLGRVKTMPKRGHKEKIMKPSLKKDGYNRIMLCKKSKYKTLYVHRLVAEAFLNCPCDKNEVNHIDGNKTNNSANNLEWVNRSQNQKHAIELGLRTCSPMLGRKGELHSTSRSIIQYELNGKFVKQWNCISDAASFYNCSCSCICNCLKGKCKSSHGYIWKYNNT